MDNKPIQNVYEPENITLSMTQGGSGPEQLISPSLDLSNNTQLLLGVIGLGNGSRNSFTSSNILQK